MIKNNKLKYILLFLYMFICYMISQIGLVNVEFMMNIKMSEMCVVGNACNTSLSNHLENSSISFHSKSRTGGGYLNRFCDLKNLLSNRMQVWKLCMICNIRLRSVWHCNLCGRLLVQCALCNISKRCWHRIIAWCLNSSLNIFFLLL